MAGEADPNLKTRVGAVIVREGKLLLIHRRKKGAEYWVLVGGKVEDGETVEEALVREVKEETSLDVLSFKKLLEIIQEGRLQVIFECECGNGEPKLGGPEKEENNEDNWYKPEWVSISKLPQLDKLYPNIITKWAGDWLGHMD